MWKQLAKHGVENAVGLAKGNAMKKSRIQNMGLVSAMSQHNHLLFVRHLLVLDSLDFVGFLRHLCGVFTKQGRFQVDPNKLHLRKRGVPCARDPRGARGARAARACGGSWHGSFPQCVVGFHAPPKRSLNPSLQSLHQHRSQVECLQRCCYVLLFLFI